MAITVHLDLMLVLRKKTSRELARFVGITEQNLSLLKSGKVRGVRFGTLAVSHPGSCAFLNWRYDEHTWDAPDVRAAWDGLLALARARPAAECRRVEGAA